jgi:hypothetical protein
MDKAYAYAQLIVQYCTINDNGDILGDYAVKYLYQISTFYPWLLQDVQNYIIKELGK